LVCKKWFLLCEGVYLAKKNSVFIEISQIFMFKNGLRISVRLIFDMTNLSPPLLLTVKYMGDWATFQFSTL